MRHTRCRAKATQLVILIATTIFKVHSHARHFRLRSLVLIRYRQEKAILFFTDEALEAQKG